MKKFLAIGLAAAFSVTMFAGCHKKGENTAPTIKGVQEEASVVAGNVWDALAGVTATDEEDGDLTSSIKVEARGLTFTDGKVTPAQARTTPYNVTYSVTDSEGETATATCKLTVDPATAELVNVYESDFSDVAPKYDWAEGNEGEGNNHWWNLTAEGGSAATATIKEGVLEVDVTNRNNVDDDKLILTRGFDDLPVGRYKFAVWAKATPDVKINLNALLDESCLSEKSWGNKNLGGGKYEQEVTAEYKVFALDFEIKADVLTEETVSSNKAKVLFRICLGGNGNANEFKFDVEKITIWKTTGSNTETDLFTLNNTATTGGLVLANVGDDSTATVGYDTEAQAVKIDITKYNPTAGGVWSIVAKAPLTGATIEANKKYGVEVDMKAETGFNPEIVIGRNGDDDGRNNDPRFVKAETSVGNTAYTKVRYDFETKDGLASFTTTTPYIFFQLGRNNESHSPNVDSNVIYIKNIRFFEVVEENETNLFELHAGASAEAPTVSVSNQGDGAGNVTAALENGEVTVNIGTYNTTGGSWSIVADIPIPQSVSTTETYGYSFDIKADHAYSNAELHFGNNTASADMSGDVMYSADIGTIGTAEYKFIKRTFKPANSIGAPVLHILLGKKDSPAETSNKIYIRNFRFFKVVGDEATSKIQDKFTVFGDEPVSVFNRSDDVFDAAPMGTAYFENGKLVYLIHQGGSDQGHNKLSIGFWDTPVGPLPANAFYVVSFKIKASVAIQFALALHDMEGGWDEGVGVLLRYADFNDNGLLEAGTEEKTITVETGLIRTAHEKCELLLEFGKWVGENKDVKIEISDVKIGYRAVV